MRRRLLQRRTSVGAVRMTVRTHVPIGVKVGLGVVAIAGAIAAGILFARSGAASPSSAPDLRAENALLIAQNRALQDQRNRMLEATALPDSDRLIDRATVKELGEQVAKLEADNARLKEDIAFFEAATADRTSSGTGDAVGAIAIRRFQVTQDRPARLVRYRILLTQDSRATRGFDGQLQIVATVAQGGRTVIIALPDAAGRQRSAAPVDASITADGSATDPYAVVFKSYKRIDGSFGLPPEAVLKTVQARILERGSVRVQQTVPG